jgi:nucleoside phosphorylase/CheY-like chemotaxis protein
MKILLVDDDPRRYRRLIERLANINVSRDEVTLVTSANDARDALEEQQFDLMVVDIILPLRPEGEPEERHSMELLSEIIEYEPLKRPRQIVGLSASEAAASTVAPFFTDRLWAVIRYNEASDDWIGQIENCIKYIQEGTNVHRETSRKADLAVMCALADPELSAILALPWNWKPAKPIDDITFVYEGAVMVEDKTYSVVASSAPRIGMVPSALLASKLIDRYRPPMIVMTGICAGMPGRCEIGDVLLADPTWDWQSGKRFRVSDRSKFAMRPHQIPVDSSIRSRFEQLRADREAFARISVGWKGATSIPKLVIGPVASGSAVLADGTITASIREQHGDVCGIDMEAYGLYAAVAVASSPRPLGFSIKAVCDFADPSKADDFQAYASYMSAKTLELFMSRYGSQVLG